jgi:hypothetical protein
MHSRFRFESDERNASTDRGTRMKTLQRLLFDGVLKCALDALFHYMGIDRGCARADHAAVRWGARAPAENVRVLREHPCDTDVLKYPPKGSIGGEGGPRLDCDPGGLYASIVATPMSCDKSQGAIQKGPQ